ncbi:MAG TPA: hypothetical protein VK421_00815 [Pyrinomonadaceae bacterium]|nr:hypothetical protein [Pyrinomonadaceae bacterium]
MSKKPDSKDDKKGGADKPKDKPAAAVSGTEAIVYPGSFTLENIQNDLVVKESQRFENLTKLELLPDAPGGEHRSLATLKEVPFGTVFGRLFLVAVPEGKMASVMADQDIKKRDFLFDAIIWVENKQTRVAAFRERAAK